MNVQIKRSTTGFSTCVFIRDVSVLTRVAGLTTSPTALAGITWTYTPVGSGTVAVSIATTTLTTFNSGGMLLVNSLLTPGLVKLDLPNASMSVTNRRVIHTIQAGTNTDVINIDVELLELDAQNGSNAGMTAIDVTSSSRMATFTLPTNFSSQVIDVSGRMDVGKWLGNVATVDSNGKPDVNIKDYGGTAVTSLPFSGTSIAVLDKTGFALAANGLDSISTIAPTGIAGNFREMLIQTWRRFFRKSTLTSTQLKTYADDGSTVITTQTVSDDGTTQTEGSA